MIRLEQVKRFQKLNNYRQERAYSMKKNNLCKDNSGFTLVELIVATAILAVIMAPLMRTFYVSLSTSQKADAYGAVTSSVTNVIENVKNANFATMAQDLNGDYGTYLGESQDDPVLHPTTNDVIGEKYYYDNGDQTVVVQWREPTTADADKLLYALDVEDLAAYTNMDLTMIQTGGSVRGEINDVDIAGVVDLEVQTRFQSNRYSDMKITSSDGSVNESDVTKYAKYMDREIKVTLNTTNITTDSDGNTLATPVEGLNYSVEYIYTVYYKYTEDDVTEIDSLSKSYEVFSGNVSSGDDNIIAMQLVYIPLNNQIFTSSAREPEKITIDYDGRLDPDTNIRLFVIKQKRATHSVGCGAYDQDQSITSPFSCTDCASAGVETANYNCNIYLNDGGTSFGTSNFSLLTNVTTNVYDDSSLIAGESTSNKFKFYYAGVDTNQTIDDLVYLKQGGRVYIVQVDIYDSKWSDFDKNNVNASKLLSSMETVKLN